MNDSINQPELTAELVIRAYCSGIYPMGYGDEVYWDSPEPRFIFDPRTFHVPKRLARKYKQCPFEMKIDTAWSDVLKNCGNRDEGTWITQPIVDVYTELHRLGCAHSVEAFQDGQLVGGLYGVSLGGAFMAESKFHIATDASKISLVYLAERLRERGYVLLDVQRRTDHLSQFGGMAVTRKKYLSLLSEALKLERRFK